jgi:hypothetical protein
MGKYEKLSRYLDIMETNSSDYYLESVYKLQPDVLQYVTPEYGKNQVAGEMGRDEDTQ